MAPELIEDVWQDRDTTAAKVEAALRGLLAERHSEMEAFVPARVLNLVVIVDAEFRGEIENRLRRITQYHPSRTIVCAVRPGQRTLDALATIAAEDHTGSAGALAVAHERVELEVGEQHLSSLDTVVGPLVVADLATLVWAPHGHDDGVDALRRLAQIVLIDSQDEPEIDVALCRAEDLAKELYVVDLAWLRSTPWRERVAAAFDPPAVRPSLRRIDAVTVRHRHDSAVSGMLFVGWLGSRLGWGTERLRPHGDGWGGKLKARRGEVRVRLEPSAGQSAPGLSGVTLQIASGEAVSLDRGPGGLRLARRARDGSEQAWTVLGASRGESGILGEGVRQALLRDPTYAPALAAARAMAG